MGLSWRDGVATLLVAAAVGVALSVVYAWNWPLIGDSRAAIVAIFLLTFPACVIGGGPVSMMAGFGWGTNFSSWWGDQTRWSGGPGSMWNPTVVGTWSPFVMLAGALGFAVSVLMIVGLIVNTVPILIWTAGLVTAIWVVTTAHHVSAQPQQRPLAPGRS